MTPSERIQTLLHQIYPENQAVPTFHRLMAMLEAAAPQQNTRGARFSELDVTLITYGDTLQDESSAPLQTLHRFLNARLKGVISTVHLLPFYPYSSDDGFSVIDYYAVNPAVGTWRDIEHLAGDFSLMFDAVINHMSAQSKWFEAFLKDEPGFQNLFLTASPQDDLSRVIRPRTSPLLTPFQKNSGALVHVWTTFSADQVDLNYRDPDTLLRILDVLLFYVKQRARVIRLDAIAFMWKEIGTSCIHLPQTHAIIQLMRAALDLAAPDVILITETNVPHPENISYFGDGFNEAQMVYNFTLPPLLFHTLLTGNAHKLYEWLNTLQTPSEQTTFFNFTASHDGIGVRPVEGILTREELQRLLDAVEHSGGRVSYKNNPDGSRSPYELNITYLDAIAGNDGAPETQISRFLLSQAIMLALAGVPAIYIHSLLGSRNDEAGMQRTGIARSINREKLSIHRLAAELDNPRSFRSQVFHGYIHLIRTRVSCRAFHPNGRQRALIYNDGQVLGVERFSPDDAETVLCVFNVTGAPQHLQTEVSHSVDLLTGQACGAALSLAPYQMRWLHRHL